MFERRHTNEPEPIGYQAHGLRDTSLWRNSQETPMSCILATPQTVTTEAKKKGARGLANCWGNRSSNKHPSVQIRHRHKFATLGNGSSEHPTARETVVGVGVSASRASEGKRARSKVVSQSGSVRRFVMSRSQHHRFQAARIDPVPSQFTSAMFRARRGSFGSRMLHGMT